MLALNTGAMYMHTYLCPVLSAVSRKILGLVVLFLAAQNYFGISTQFLAFKKCSHYLYIARVYLIVTPSRKSNLLLLALYITAVTVTQRKFCGVFP